MKTVSEQLLRDVVYRGVESDELDYKAHQSWSALNRAGRGKIVRHLIALANTKGGFLVIGVGEEPSGRPALYTGLTEEESNSFDPTAVGSFVNRCVEPPINFSIERPEIDGKRYVIFVVQPFSQLPHVCCNSVDTELTCGVFYIRTPEASSRPASRAFELQQLIQRAMRNQREQLARVLRGILYENGSVPSGEAGVSRFAAAIGGSADFFRRRYHVSSESVIMQIAVIPENFDESAFQLSELRSAAESAWRWCPGGDFFDAENIDQAYMTNVSLRFMPVRGVWMWQLYKTGLFHCIGAFPPGRRINGDLLIRRAVDAAGFIGRLYSELGWQEEQPVIKVELNNTENAELDTGYGTAGICRIPKVEFLFQRSAADLTAGSNAHAGRIIRGIGERFNLSGEQLKEVDTKVKSWSKGR